VCHTGEVELDGISDLGRNGGWLKYIAALADLDLNSGSSGKASEEDGLGEHVLVD